MSFNKLWLLVPVVIIASYMNCGKLESNGVGGALLGSLNLGQHPVGNDNLIFSSLPVSQISIGREFVLSSQPSFFAEPVTQVFWDHNLDGTGFCSQSDGDSPWSVRLNCSQAGDLNIYLIVEYSSGVEIEYAAQLTVLADAPPSTSPIFPTPTPAPLNGATLYTVSCAGCHGGGATTDKRNRSAGQIQSAINNNVGNMGSLSSLTPAEVAAIAAYLNQ